MAVLTWIAISRLRLLIAIHPETHYPPDLQDAAVQNVLQQPEALSAEWAA